jgi:hypothetical protein
MKFALITQNLMSAFELKKPAVVSIVGSGGKTTLMYRLAQELMQKNKKVISTTTTKIYPPKPEQSPKLILDSKIRAQYIEPLLKKYQHITLAKGKNQENKLVGLDPEVIDQLNDNLINKGKLDYFLVEADGSRGKSLKGYRLLKSQIQNPKSKLTSQILNLKSQIEPVLPRSTKLCIVVLGWDILGKPLNERYVHRSKILSLLINVKINTKITIPILIKTLCISGGYLSRIPAKCKLIVFINKADLESDERRLTVFCQKLSPRPIDRIVIGSLQDAKTTNKIT